MKVVGGPHMPSVRVKERLPSTTISSGPAVSATTSGRVPWPTAEISSGGNQVGERMVSISAPSCAASW